MTAVRVRGVIFDFDGVLVDSEPIRFAAGVRALEEIGVALTWERFLAVWLGRTDQAGLRALLGERYETEANQVVARRNELYDARLDEVPPYADAAHLLGRLSSDFRLAVATGSRRVEVVRILTRLGWIQRFQAIVTAEDYRRAKPAPDPFLTAAGHLHLPADACLVVEDSPAGVLAAHAAGMPVLAVDRGRGAAGLEQATWTVASLDAIRLSPEGEVVVRA